MTSTPKSTSPTALRKQIAVHAGQISALIAELAAIRARLDKLEVVQPGATTEPVPEEPQQ